MSEFEYLKRQNEQRIARLPKSVRYQGKAHKVIVGGGRFWKLASNYQGGSPFLALKSECK